MPYSVFVFVALAIHILTNFNIFSKKNDMVALKSFRLFIISIAVFYLTDAAWGIFEGYKMVTALYIDTFIYFIMMGATIFFWTGFVVNYLENKSVFSKIVRAVGIAFFLAEVVLLIINFFFPVLFTVDTNCVYEAYIGRNVMLYAQIGMYSLITIFSFIYTIRFKAKLFKRYIAISLFSLIMITCIAIQLGDPYIPFYSIGCLVGVIVLNNYAIIESKDHFKEAYKEVKKENLENEERLGEVTNIAFTDTLTGTRSRYAFVEKEIQIDNLINEKGINQLSVVVFDINGLKNINDTLGHDAGDKYIIDCVTLITKYFPIDLIYRFGGDEFVAILINEDVNKYKEKYRLFMKEIDENLIEGNKPIVSSGVARYRAETDNTFKAIFYRADKMMYSRKEYLKEHAQ